MAIPGGGPDTRTMISDAEIAAGVVCMMCGVAGSGKTTLAQQLEARGMVRLSVDEEIWQRFGRYGLDYEPAQYAEHQAAASTTLDAELATLMQAGVAVVLDYSFWQRAHRERYKTLIERHGRPWRLLVLHVDPAVLRRRLVARSKRFDADAAVPITDDLLDSYLHGFEWPQGEGETEVRS
jgi:predicted kinase